MMDKGKRRPLEWAKEKDLHVLDPDGWRNEGRSWFEPVTEEEFDRMAADSTVGPRKAKR